jgi:hypothetical protein
MSSPESERSWLTTPLGCLVIIAAILFFGALAYGFVVVVVAPLLSSLLTS